MEDNIERKQWFINAQNRLNQEKKELGNEILKFIAQNEPLLED